MRGIETQFLALQKGFSELISQHLLRPFDERELEVRELTACHIGAHVTCMLDTIGKPNITLYVICICCTWNMFYMSDTVIDAQERIFK